jgi:hypothetical protein
VERHCNWRGAGSRKRFMRERADTGPTEETKRTLTQQFLDCVTSQVITIDDLTSDVAGIARGAVSLGRGPCCGRVQSRQSERTGAQSSRWPGGFRN